MLKEAGVVDAGGAGLLEIIRGVRAAVAGEPAPEASAEAVALSVEAMHQELSEYRYCTVFVIEGAGLDADGLERDLEALGDSLLVVGDSSALKVHVHTDDPGAALSLGTASGTIDGVEIADMHRQTLEREERLAGGTLEGLPTLETGIVVVAPGEGNRRLFKSLRATRVIEGGQTMNPSTEEIVAAVDATPATEVIVLPNNSNVILSAEQAIGLVNKPMRVVPTRSVQAGLAAMIAYDPEQSATENESSMGRALEGVATGEVTVASRDVRARRDRGAKGCLARARRRRGRCQRPELRHRGGGGRRAAARRWPRDPDAPDRRRGAATGRARERDRGAPPGARDRDPRGWPAALSVAALGGVTMAVRVLLVEDNEVYRSTLELLLDGRDGLEIVGSVGDGRDAADAAEQLSPDVVLMDFRLPGLDGAEATAAIRTRTPHAAILCLTAEATEADRAAVLAAGAAGLIEKSSSIDEVVRAIHSATERGDSNP